MDNQRTISKRVKIKTVRVRETARLSPDELTSQFLNENPETQFNKKQIHRYAWAYLAFCRKVKGNPSHEGFADKMEAKAEQRARRKTPGQHHCATRTTEEKLSDFKWSEGPYLDLGDEDSPVNSSPVDPLF